MKKLSALLMASAMVLTMTACNNNSAPANETPQPSAEASAPVETIYKVPTTEASVWQGYSAEELADEDVSGKNIAYQFVESHTDNRNISVMVNLYEDGFARISQYSEGGQGVMSYYYYGYWTSVNDEYIYMGYSAYSYEGQDVPAQNVYHGDIATVDYSYELTLNDGAFAFSLNACLGFGNGGVYVRSVDMAGDGSVQYTNEADFIAYADDYWTNYSGEQVTVADDDIEIPENSIVVETFGPDVSSQISDGFFVTSDAWGPVLMTSGSYAPTDSEDSVFTMTSTTGKPYIITFYANGTYTFEYPGMVSENGTWTWESWTMTMTTPAGVTYTGNVKK